MNEQTIVHEVEAYLRSLPVVQDTAEEFRALYERDYHTCDCSWPHVERAWGGAVGTFREIRLCCMARALERLMGLPEGTFYWTADFTPLFPWDCDEIVTEQDAAGNLRQRRRGAPPRWMVERMERKAIPIRNLPNHE